MIIATSHETKSLSMDDRPGGDIPGDCHPGYSQVLKVTHFKHPPLVLFWRVFMMEKQPTSFKNSMATLA